MSSAAASPTITEQDLRDKSVAELRHLADRLGLRADPRRPDRFLDPVTGRERLRIDAGHVDITTGEPYRNATAAVPHVHAYPPGGPRNGSILDTHVNDAHFPIRRDNDARAF